MKDKNFLWWFEGELSKGVGGTFGRFTLFNTTSHKPLNVLDDVKDAMHYRHDYQELPAAYRLRETPI